METVAFFNFFFIKAGWGLFSSGDGDGRCFSLGGGYGRCFSSGGGDAGFFHQRVGAVLIFFIRDGGCFLLVGRGGGCKVVTHLIADDTTAKSHYSPSKARLSTSFCHLSSLCM